MKAGFFETDITPARGMERPGSYQKRYVESVHDPLKARASVFDDGQRRVALVGIDTCTIDERTVAEARRRIEAQCGIDPGSVMIGASHTHAGGPLFGYRAAEYEGASPLIRELGTKQRINIDPVYEERAIEQLAAAVTEASRRAQECLLSFGCGREEHAAFNRRFKMRNGRVYTHPGKGNPDIIEPAGPIDPDVGVLGAWSKSGELLGCVVNYACHATTFPGAVSADWIFHLENTIRGVFGKACGVVFLNGACGDVTQVDNQSLRESEFGERWARHVGTRVGGEAVKVLVSAERSDRATLAASSNVLKIKRRRPAADRLKRCKELVEKSHEVSGSEWTDSSKATESIFAREALLIDYIAERYPVANVELQAIQIGPAAFLSNPSEYFCALGLEIKKASPFPMTCVVTMANGSVGYVPDEAAFEPSGGGYETILTSYSNLETKAGSTIRDESIRLARSLKPDPLPFAPGKPGSPWSYGILGPDA
jgi:hypothetical protein